MSDSSQDVYRQLNVDMRDGLKTIFQQISSASTQAGSTGRKSDALFSEASDQLREVVKTTEEAAMNIMEIVEQEEAAAERGAQLLAELSARIGDDPLITELAAINARLRANLMTLLTTLGFQDITGQRIKKVASALAEIEQNVLELYLSSGLALDGAAREPHKDAQTLKAEAQKAVEEFQENRMGQSALKGPDANGCTQAAIDDMLSQLGL